MIEKVNPSHPDKIADRIAGALVDLAYRKNTAPKIAVEVLIGHGVCHIIAETSEDISSNEACEIVHRIAGDSVEVDYVSVKQDSSLSRNQSEQIKCGDNGIFRGCPVTKQQRLASRIARQIYSEYPSDGKYVLDKNLLVACQSKCPQGAISEMFPFLSVKENPLGYWDGGIDVDSGATNRKLGSDMADSITGGGIHGKDLSKADVSVNIYAFMKAQEEHRPIEMCCAIGDTEIDGVPYSEIVEKARSFINRLGGFEKLAEWGLY